MPKTDHLRADSTRLSNFAQGFENLFNQHWERVYAVLYRLTGDPDEAEDLALETFYRLWQQPPAQLDSPGGWLYRVATRLGLNFLRSSRRRSTYELQAGRDGLDQSIPVDPQAETERSEQRAVLKLVLNQMKPRDSQLIILRHSGLTYQEIAAALELNPASVGSLLNRAEGNFLQICNRLGVNPQIKE